MTAEQLLSIVKLLVEKELPVEQAQKLLDKGAMSDLCDFNFDGFDRDKFRQFGGLHPLVLEFLLDYNLTVEQMIAAGGYDWTNPDITSTLFAVKGEGQHKRLAQLIHFDEDISSDEAKKRLYERGLRPGKFEELLGFGAKYPKTQKKFPIIALGSVARLDGSGLVAYLDESDSRRNLSLDCRGDDWDRRCRFLAFAK
ncbi:MAG: hypothetical protein AAB453_00040 [Patescibacteria group bacterium]